MSLLFTSAMGDSHIHLKVYLFAQVFNFGADLIIFVKQFNEILLYLTEL